MLLSQILTFIIFIIKITKDENGKSVPTEIVLVHCNVVINDDERNSRVFYTFFQKGHSADYKISHRKI